MSMPKLLWKKTPEKMKKRNRGESRENVCVWDERESITYDETMQKGRGINVKAQSVEKKYMEQEESEKERRDSGQDENNRAINTGDAAEVDDVVWTVSFSMRSLGSGFF